MKKITSSISQHIANIYKYNRLFCYKKLLLTQSEILIFVHNSIHTAVNFACTPSTYTRTERSVRIPHRSLSILSQ